MTGSVAGSRATGEDTGRDDGVGVDGGGEVVDSGVAPFEEAWLGPGETMVPDRDGEGEGIELAHPAINRELNSVAARTLGTIASTRAWSTRFDVLETPWITRCFAPLPHPTCNTTGRVRVWWT